MRSCFKPSNAVLCLAGNVDETRAINQINKHFADIISEDNIIRFSRVSKPRHYKRYLIESENSNRISVCAAVQTPPRGHEDTAVFHILKYIVIEKFANGMRGTFPCTVNADFIEKRALSLFIVHIEIINKDDRRRALICQRSLLSGFGLNVSKGELDKAKCNFRLDYYKQMAPLSRRALRLSERCLNGDSPLTISEEVDKPCAVSNQDIKRIVNTYFRHNNTRITELQL